MRISDWSSDVCSSDLDDRRAVSAPDKKLTGYASSGRDVDEGFTSNAPRLQGPQARHADRDRQRPQLLQAAFAVLSNHPRTTGRPPVSVRLTPRPPGHPSPAPTTLGPLRHPQTHPPPTHTHPHP